MKIDFLKQVSTIGAGLLFLIIISLQSSISFAQDMNSGYQKKSWDYSLGSEYSKPAYTPLKKIESEVLYFPYIAHQQETDTASPMGSDFYAYTMPESIFGIETIELEFEEGVPEIENGVEIERLIKELEDAAPLVFKDAVKRQGENLPVHKYGLRVKVQIAEVESVSEEEEAEQQDIQEESKSPKEREINVFINIIFGQNKIVIKIPPLDPKAKERLIKELERIAHILARQDDLIDINQISD
ncbi:MAG: hypothetical protein P9L98_02965 [Candidatus Kaelpia imicola]|nr:hypothetical protein [Candidatus Kaelpia imicola]